MTPLEFKIIGIIFLTVIAMTSMGLCVWIFIKRDPTNGDSQAVAGTVTGLIAIGALFGILKLLGVVTGGP